MKKFKIRSYIEKQPTKALHDLDEFYRQAREIIIREAGMIKDETDWKNLNFTMDNENRNISALHRFYRGAVLPYYIRQSTENFDVDWKPDRELVEKKHDEIKQQIGFFTYNHEGKPTGYNTFSNFEETKAFSDTLQTIEEVVFEDQGYLFPDSEHYKELEKKYGKQNAPNVAAAELKQYYENRKNL